MREFSHSQNFLTNINPLKRFIKEAGFNEKDTVIDIGAGKGVITKELIKTPAKVVAIEGDAQIYEELKKIRSESENLQILNIKFEDFRFPSEDFKVFANIPFNYTSDIIKKLLNKPNFVEGYFFIQLEAARRYKGDDASTMVSVLNYPFFDFRILHRFSKYDFEPPPSVKVVLLKIERKKNPTISEDKVKKYKDFVAFVFNNSIPNLKASLKKLMTENQIRRTDINLNLSPTLLTPKDYLNLFNLLIFNKDLTKVDGAFDRMDERNLKKDHRTRIRKFRKD